MKKRYYLIFRIVGNEKEILKDPDFCKGEEIPFETFFTNKDTFLPWLSEHKATAQSQASLLEDREGNILKYSVAYADIDYMKLLKDSANWQPIIN